MADGGGPGRLGERAPQLAAEDAPDQREVSGVDPPAGEAAARRAEHAALLEVEGGERARPRRRSGRTASSIGWKPSSESSFQKNAALTSGSGARPSVRSAPDEHPVERGVGLALLRDLVGGLEHRDRVGEAAVVLAQRAVGVDGLDLGDDVELAAPVALQRDVARGLEPRPEPAPRLAHALGHRPDLAVPLGEDGDDPVGLPQLDRAQHDPLVPVQVHYTSVIRPPRRACVSSPSYATVELSRCS